MLSQLETGLIRDLPFDQINPNLLLSFYLRGLQDLFVDKDGTPWDASWFNFCISQGMMLVEQRCNIAIEPQQRVELHDYEHEQVSQYLLLNLEFPPVVDVVHFSAVYPADFQGGGVPAWIQGSNTIKFDDIEPGNVAFDFPKNWIRVREDGQVQIVPLAGGIDSAFLGVGSVYLPLLFGALYRLPQLWRVEYICGFHNQQVPFIVVDAIMKASAIEALSKVAETLRPPGVTNIELGLGNQVRRSYSLDAGRRRGTAALFGDLLSKYREDLFGSRELPSKVHEGGLLQQIRDKYHGIPLYPV